MASTLEVSVRRGRSPAGHESLVAVLAGELDVSTAPRLAAGVDALLDTGLRQITVDVTGLTFVDVAGLRVLLAFQARARQQLSVVHIAGASAHMRRVMAIVSPAWSPAPGERDNSSSARPVTARPPA